MYNTCAGTSNFLIIYILTNKSTLTCTVLASVGPDWPGPGPGRPAAAMPHEKCSAWSSPPPPSPWRDTGTG